MRTPIVPTRPNVTRISARGANARLRADKRRTPCRSHIEIARTAGRTAARGFGRRARSFAAGAAGCL